MIICEGYQSGTLEEEMQLVLEWRKRNKKFLEGGEEFYEKRGV